MNVSVQKLEDNKVVLTITVEQKEVAKAYDSAWKGIATKINIPGFRKGKAPRKIVESRVGLEAIKEEAFDIIAKKVYGPALDQADVEPVSHPSVDIETLEEDKDAKFTVTVTVKPEATLGEYKGLEVEKVVREIGEQDVLDSLEKLREKKAEMVVVEDAVLQKGDLAVIDFAGFIDGQAFSGGEGKAYPLEIGSGSFIPGFEDQLIGAKKGQECQVKVSFPEDYFAKELAGKEAEFKVTVHDVKRKTMPELTDEFIKDNSEFATVDEWKKDCLERLEKLAQDNAQREYENNLVKKAIDNASVEIPEIMVQNKITDILQDMAYSLQQRGLKFEDYLKYINKTVEELRESYKESATADVKAELVMDAIAKVENLKVEEQELQTEVEMMAQGYGQSVDEIKKTLVKTGNIYMVNKSILRRKAARLILGN